LTRDTIGLAQARRIALAAQGFGTRPRPEGAEPTRQHIVRVLQRLGAFQIDSVNVVTRAHYMPAFSRLGPYPAQLVDASLSRKPRRAFEYWAHEASLLPAEVHPLLRWRMEEGRAGRGIYKGLATFGREMRDFIDQVLAEVERNGPLTAAAIEGHRGASGWWQWSEAKRALEWLFWAGLVTTHSRGPNFERLYDIPDRVMPREILALPTPEPREAKRGLIERAARALGIATRSDLRDYFRLRPDDAYPRIEELVEDGTLFPVRVEGWSQTAYLHREARTPRKVRAAALLAPFDPLIWERSRVERLFDFRYRLGIYTPVHNRVHGYYVFPFLLDDQLVARVDLKADRKAGVLRVLSAHPEDDAPDETPARLAAELGRMAAWLGLERAEMSGRDCPFAQRLARALEDAPEVNPRYVTKDDKVTS